MSSTLTKETVEQCRVLNSKIAEAIHQKIVGQNLLVERLVIALLADGHVLLEGVPGLAKTKTLTVLASALDATMSRIQFTPDLLPSDLVGTEVFRPQTGEFVTRKGPLFANIVLADEINRAPAKVQSALLQAMQERMVTIGEKTFELPKPFLVLATQNPIEQEGTYPLPEAQVDRFLMKVSVTYPTFDEEMGILKLLEKEDQQLNQVVRPVLSLSDLTALKKAAAAVYCDEKINRYIVSLVHATRTPDPYNLKGMIEWGASPRASIALQRCAKALALLRGKEWVTIDEVKDIAPDVLRHRVLSTFEAESRGISSDSLVSVLLKSVPVP